VAQGEAGEAVRARLNVSQSAYRPDIDGLRAVAVLAVVLYHLGGFGVTGGYGGVDVFFVISGFLICGILKAEIAQGRFSLATFYERRCRRIFPALFAVLAVTTIAAVAVLLPRDLRDFGESLRSVAAFVANYYFARKTGYFDAAAEEKPLLHLWSLSVEEQFYIFFPLLLMLVARYRPKWCVPVFATAAAASLALSAHLVASDPARAYFATPGRAWELLVGVLVTYAVAPRARIAREGLAALGLALIAYGCFVYTDATPFPGPSALVFCVGAGLVIVAGSGGPTLAGRLLSTPPMVGIGLISYSLYLWHWPLIVFLRYRFQQVFEADGSMPIGLQLALLAASVLLAYLSWRFIEAPFRRAKARRSRVFAWFGGLTAALLGISLALTISRGLPSRWPADVLSLIDETELRKSSLCLPVDAGSGWPRGVCRAGNSAVAPTTLLWGDSHAQFYTNVMHAEAVRTGQGLLVAAIGGCPPMTGIVLEGRSKAEACHELADAVVRQVATQGIRRVVLAARWAYYVEGSRYGGEAGEPAILSARGVENNQSIVETQLEATVKAIAATGAEVVLLGPVPEQRFKVSPAVVRERVWGQTLPPAETHADFEVRQRHVMPLLEKLSHLPHVRILYPDRLLCDAQTCAFAHDGLPLYTDNNHLSIFGLQRIAPMVAEIFQVQPTASR